MTLFLKYIEYASSLVLAVKTKSNNGFYLSPLSYMVIEIAENDKINFLLGSMSLSDVIQHKLEESLKPEDIQVINESHLHKGHAGDDGSGETHFKLIVVSKMFDGKSQIERSRLVHKVLKEEIDGPIHALSIMARTPSEI